MSSIGAVPPATSALRQLSPLTKKGDASAKVKASNSSSLDSETNVYQAQKNASDQISAIHQSVEQAQAEGNQRIDQIQEEYQEQGAAESARQETAYNQQQAKGYERIRDLQRNQQAELARVHREGEHELAKDTGYYRDSIYNTHIKGDAELKQELKNQAKEMDYITKVHNAEIDKIKADQQQELDRQKAERDDRFINSTASTQKEYERIAKNNQEMITQANERFNQHFQEIKNQHDSTLSELNARTHEQLQGIRQNSANKLAGYSERQDDPFYKLVDLKAEVSDEGDAFVLTARIPEHEQGSVKVSIQGDQLVLSGYRRNEEKLDLAPGHSQSTASYQSFHESFPLDSAVDKNKLTKKFEGDRLTARIPKKSDFTYTPHKITQKVDRTRVEQPQFPGNIPYVQVDIPPDPDADPPAATPKTRGGRTLS